MTRITDEAVEAAAKVILVAATGPDNLSPVAIRGYSPLARATLVAALPHLEGATPAIDREALIEAGARAMRPVLFRGGDPRPGTLTADEQDRTRASAALVVDAILALIGGAS